MARRSSREHNDANILVPERRQDRDDQLAQEIVETWLATPFAGGRHQRRVDKITQIEQDLEPANERQSKNTDSKEDVMSFLEQIDPEVFAAIQKETQRLEGNLELIASENFVSEAVLEAQGSVMTNKYAEGYPGKRYYGGCEYVDEVESLAIERAKELFGADHANVQPHSGAQANMAVYLAVLKPGDTLSGHEPGPRRPSDPGHPVNFSGIHLSRRFPTACPRRPRRIDYDEVERLAKEHRPKMIVAGASAYPRIIDYRALPQDRRRCRRAA